MSQLSGQQMAEVLEALRAPVPGKSGAEKRNASRMTVEAQVAVAAWTDGKPGRSLIALTRDLSSRGIGLFQSVPWPVGQQFVIRLPRGPEAPLFVLARVLMCVPRADGIYNIGGEFLQVLAHAPDTLLDNPDAIEPLRQAVLAG